MRDTRSQDSRRGGLGRRDSARAHGFSFFFIPIFSFLLTVRRNESDSPISRGPLAKNARSIFPECRHPRLEYIKGVVGDSLTRGHGSVIFRRRIHIYIYIYILENIATKFAVDTRRSAYISARASLFIAPPNLRLSILLQRFLLQCITP